MFKNWEKKFAGLKGGLHERILQTRGRKFCAIVSLNIILSFAFCPACKEIERKKTDHCGKAVLNIYTLFLAPDIPAISPPRSGIRKIVIPSLHVSYWLSIFRQKIIYA
jgi:hypothetical protein